MPGPSDKESRRTNLRSVPGWALNELLLTGPGIVHLPDEQAGVPEMWVRVPQGSVGLIANSVIWLMAGMRSLHSLALGVCVVEFVFESSRAIAWACARMPARGLWFEQALILPRPTLLALRPCVGRDCRRQPCSGSAHLRARSQTTMRWSE